MHVLHLEVASVRVIGVTVCGMAWAFASASRDARQQVCRGLSGHKYGLFPQMGELRSPDSNWHQMARPVISLC